ncbi:MAG: hypothetical protein ACK5LO_15605 [Leucobacter sp.]
MQTSAPRTPSAGIGTRSGIGALIVAAVAAVALAALALLTLAPSGAFALPPDGAGPDSPGTSSRVWPTEVKPGDKLNFEVSGYPANETVYIKIDDGQMCSESSHGACVYAMQKLDGNGNGYGSGSIIVPDLAPGAHWLRMLATGDQFDAKTGENIGYLGYTRRGGNDFTVVGGSGGSSGAGGGAAAGSAAEAGEGGEEDIEGGSIDIDVAGDDADAAGDADKADSKALEDQMVDISKGEEAKLAAAAAPDATAANTQPGSELPVLGITVLGISVLIGAGAIAWALIARKRRAAGVPAAAPAAPSTDTPATPE